MNRTPAERAFIHGYILVANSVAGVTLVPSDETFDAILAENRHVWDRSRLYYEAHITVEPNPLGTFELFRDAFSDADWRVSAFAEDDVDQIVGKWFITARHTLLSEMEAMVSGMVQRLSDHGLTVLRSKIEDTLMDTKYGDAPPPTPARPSAGDVLADADVMHTFDDSVWVSVPRELWEDYTS